MTIQLTPEQRQDVQQHGDRPVNVIDPVTQKVYVLMAGDMFDRFKALFDDEPFDIRETYAAQQSALAKVWDDPALDVYNDDIPAQR